MAVKFSHLHTEQNDILFEKYLDFMEKSNIDYRTTKYAVEVKNRLFDKDFKYPVDVILLFNEFGILLGSMVYYLFPSSNTVLVSQFALDGESIGNTSSVVNAGIMLFNEMKEYISTEILTEDKKISYIFLMLDSPLVENNTIDILDFLINLELKPYKVHVKPEDCIKGDILPESIKNELEEPKWLINIMNESKYLNPDILAKFLFDWAILTYNIEDSKLSNLEDKIKKALMAFKTEFPVHDIEHISSNLLTNVEYLFSPFDYSLLKNIDKEAFLEKFYEKHVISVVINFIDDGNLLKFSEVYTEMYKIIDIVQTLYNKDCDILTLYSEKLNHIHKRFIKQIWIDGITLILPAQII